MTWSEFLVNANGLFFRENGHASAGRKDAHLFLRFFVRIHQPFQSEADVRESLGFVNDDGVALAEDGRDIPGRAHLQTLYVLRIVAVVETDVASYGNFFEKRGFADAAAAEQDSGSRRSLQSDGGLDFAGMIMKIPVYKMEISKVFSVINRNFRSAKQLNRLLTGDKQTEKLSFFAIKKIFFK